MSHKTVHIKYAANTKTPSFNPYTTRLTPSTDGASSLDRAPDSPNAEPAPVAKRGSVPAGRSVLAHTSRTELNRRAAAGRARHSDSIPANVGSFDWADILRHPLFFLAAAASVGFLIGRWKVSSKS